MFRKILRRLTKSQQEDESWPSLVLLLKKHQPLSDDHLLQLTDKTYGMAGPNGRISPELIGRTPDGYGRVFRIQFFFISVTEIDRKYEVAGQEASEMRQLPWDEHTAWRSVDFPKQSALKPEERNEIYKTLFFLISQLWNENCLALYVPEEGLTIPNLGGWKESLVWAGKNGSNLDFLRRTTSVKSEKKL